jgi:hypothetical protein
MHVQRRYSRWEQRRTKSACTTTPTLYDMQPSVAVNSLPVSSPITEASSDFKRVALLHISRPFCSNCTSGRHPASEALLKSAYNYLPLGYESPKWAEYSCNVHTCLCSVEIRHRVNNDALQQLGRGVWSIAFEHPIEISYIAALPTRRTFSAWSATRKAGDPSSEADRRPVDEDNRRVAFGAEQFQN